MSAFDEILAGADPEVIAAFDTMAAHAVASNPIGWQSLEVDRLAVDLDGTTIHVLRPTPDGQWVRVREGATTGPDDYMPTGKGAAQELLDALDRAAAGDSVGLRVTRWRTVVEHVTQSTGQLALDEARALDPEVELGDELGQFDAEATAALWIEVLTALRRAAPLTIVASFPDADAAVARVLDEEVARTGRTREDILGHLGRATEPARLDQAILSYDYDLEGLEYAANPDAPDHAPTELAALVPLDDSLAAALVRAINVAHPLPPPPGNDVDGLLERWRSGEDIVELANELRPEDRRVLITALAGYTNVDEAWHVLFALAERDPDDRALVERSLTDWSDGARLMPRHWWAAIKEGRFDPVHRLVRQLMVNADDAPVLSLPGVEQSLGGLTGLGLQQIDEPQLLAILGHPWLRNIQQLHVRGVTWTPSIAERLATMTTMAGVRTLVIGGGVLAPEALADLWVGSSFPRLERLEISAPTTTRPSGHSYEEQVVDDPVPLVEVADALRGRPLARDPFELELKGLGVDTAGIRAIARQPALAGLSGLIWTFCVLDEHDLRLLAASPLQLERFELHLGTLGPEGARALGEASWLAKLGELALPAKRTGDAPMAALLERCGSLRRLVLRHNGLGEQTANVLASMPLRELEHLELSYNPISDDDLGRILANPSLSSLKRFEALGTGASVAVGRAMAEHEHLAELQVVNLGDHVDDEAIGWISRATLPRLRRLQVRGASDAALGQLQSPDLFVTNAMFG